MLGALEQPQLSLDLERGALRQQSRELFALILVVCALFVTNAASAAVRARRDELGVLACLGWSTGRLFAVVLAEAPSSGSPPARSAGCSRCRSPRSSASTPRPRARRPIVPLLEGE